MNQKIDILERMKPGSVNPLNYAGLGYNDGEKFAEALRELPETQWFDCIDEWYKDQKTDKLIYEVTFISGLSEDVDIDSVRNLFGSHLERLLPFAQVDPDVRWDAAMSSAYSRIFGAVGGAHGANKEMAMCRDEAYNNLFFFSSGWSRAGPGPDFDAIITLSRNAAYEMISKTLGHPNPWRPLVDIYRQGALVSGYHDRNLTLLTENGSVELKL